ncbi:caspase family protein [Clostridium perfringens]|nr:caspase family protein [Clostridium perfringens]
MNKKQQEILNNKIGKNVLISIGINHYSDRGEFQNLKKCINDATEIYNIFGKTKPLNFDEEKSILMISDEGRASTSKNEIVENIKDVCKKVEENERIIFFFSGHGHELNNNNYLVPSNIENITKEELICINDIVSILEESKAKVKIILLDSCCSGVVNKDSKGLSGASFVYMKDYIDSTRATVIISACGKSEYATEESPNKNLSLFTTYLAEALEGKFEALDNGYLTINSLYEYILNQMTKISREYAQINQSPNLNVRANSNAVIGLYNYNLFKEDNDFDNYYKIILNERKIQLEDNPYEQIEKKGKILMAYNLWRETQSLLNELILNIFDHGNAKECNLQFSNNKIILSDNGDKFDPTKELLEPNDKLSKRGYGRDVFYNYLDKNTKDVDIFYNYEEEFNKIIISFKNTKAFDIEGLCKIEVKDNWLRRYTKEDITLPKGICKKYYYVIDMLSPCMSIASSAINTILSVIPEESKLVVIDKNNEYINLSSQNYEPNPRIIYRDK